MCQCYRNQPGCSMGYAIFLVVWFIIGCGLGGTILYLNVDQYRHGQVEQSSVIAAGVLAGAHVLCLLLAILSLAQQTCCGKRRKSGGVFCVWLMLSILQALLFALYSLVLGLLITAVVKQQTTLTGDTLVGFAIVCVVWVGTLSVFVPTTLVTHALNPCNSSFDRF